MADRRAEDVVADDEADPSPRGDAGQRRQVTGERGGVGLGLDGEHEGGAAQETIVAQLTDPQAVGAGLERDAEEAVGEGVDDPLAELVQQGAEAGAQVAEVEGRGLDELGGLGRGGPGLGEAAQLAEQAQELAIEIER